MFQRRKYTRRGSSSERGPASSYRPQRIGIRPLMFGVVRPNLSAICGVMYTVSGTPIQEFRQGKVQHGKPRTALLSGESADAEGEASDGDFVAGRAIRASHAAQESRLYH